MPRLTPFAIGPHSDPYMLRWRLFPANPWGNVYLHWYRHDDEDRALHDHPWWSVSFRLFGKLKEIYLDNNHTEQSRYIPWLLPVVRNATFTHRLVLPKKNALTIFVTGRRVREWGFHCPQGFRPWFEFVDPKSPGERGPGCD